MTVLSELVLTIILYKQEEVDKRRIEQLSGAHTYINAIGLNFQV